MFLRAIVTCLLIFTFTGASSASATPTSTATTAAAAGHGGCDFQPSTHSGHPCQVTHTWKLHLTLHFDIGSERFCGYLTWGAGQGIEIIVRETGINPGDVFTTDCAVTLLSHGTCIFNKYFQVTREQ